MNKNWLTLVAILGVTSVIRLDELLGRAVDPAEWLGRVLGMSFWPFFNAYIAGKYLILFTKKYPLINMLVVGLVSLVVNPSIVTLAVLGAIAIKRLFKKKAPETRAETIQQSAAQVAVGLPARGLEQGKGSPINIAFFGIKPSPAQGLIAGSVAFFVGAYLGSVGQIVGSIGAILALLSLINIIVVVLRGNQNKIPREKTNENN